jgi:hypothetical protein
MRRVTMAAGSLLLWNQTTVHGAVPNRSDRPRVAQFVRGFRAGEMGPARAAARAAAVARELKKAHSLGALTALAAHVFQVDQSGAPIGAADPCMHGAVPRTQGTDSDMRVADPCMHGAVPRTQGTDSGMRVAEPSSNSVSSSGGFGGFRGTNGGDTVVGSGQGAQAHPGAIDGDRAATVAETGRSQREGHRETASTEAAAAGAPAAVSLLPATPTSTGDGAAVKILPGARWPGQHPRQLSADDAAAFSFSVMLDLLPDDEGPFLVPVHPDADRRTPLTYRQLRKLAHQVCSSAALDGWVMQQAIVSVGAGLCLPACACRLASLLVCLLFRKCVDFIALCCDRATSKQWRAAVRTSGQ